MAQKTRLRQELQKQRRRDSVLRKVLIAIGVALLAVYIVGCIFFHKHFYVGGTVFGISMRGQTVESLKEQVREKVGAYEIVINTRDGKEKISADDIGLAYNDQGEIDQMLKGQKTFAWFLMGATSKDDQSIHLVMNEAMLTDAVKGLSCMQEESMTAPTDAYLEYVENQFVVRDETYGNKLEFDTVYDVVYNSVLEGANEISLDELECYAAPEIYQDNPMLREECNEVNKLIGVVITYDFGDRNMVVDGSVIEKWIKFQDDFKYELDQEAIEKYVYEMAYETDTFGLSRKFKTHSGSEITLKGGDYGWCIQRPKTVEQLKELVLAGESVTVEPVYRYTGVCRDTNDIGKNYVEVSIAAQTMWVYKDGECIVSTPVVTGNSSKGHDTPAGGVWAVDARISPYTLSGQDYNTDVNYWLPFNGNVGIHDATWRDSFGGSIYKTSGSHGCVNTPLSAMKTVYANVQIGYPVVVY